MFSALKVNLLFLLLAFLIPNLNCQERGISLINDDKGGEGEVWGLIVGISKYKNLPLHNQLQFADADALACYNLLINQKSVNKVNISLLLNDEANQGAIYSKLNFILNNAKSNDIVFIYFAGHGDVSSKIDDGFFLLSNAVSDQYGDYYSSDVLIISDLKKYLAEFVKKNIKVVLITDACRSGKVLDEEGAKNTFSVLMTEWNNIIKLASCEPGEFSYEDKKWGNGHGVFTYYLIEGLKGFSDKDNDHIIQLGELYDDVKLKVNEQTKDSTTNRAKQNPVKSGPTYFNILSIDKTLQSINPLDTNSYIINEGEPFPRGIIKCENNSYSNLFHKAILQSRFLNVGHQKKPKIMSSESHSFERVAVNNFYANEKSNFFAIWDNSGKALVYNLKKHEFKTLSKNKSKEKSTFLHHIFLSSDGKLFGKCFYNKTISIIDCDKDSTICSFKIEEDPLYVTFSEDNNLIIFYKDRLQLVSINKTPQKIKSIKVHQLSKIENLYNNHIVIYNSNNRFSIVNLSTLEIVYETKIAQKKIKDIDIDIDRNRLLILTDEKLFAQELGSDSKNLMVLDEEVSNFNKLTLFAQNNVLLLSSPTSIKYYDLISHVSYEPISIPVNSIVYPFDNTIHFIQLTDCKIAQFRVELPSPYAVDLLEYFPSNQKDSLSLLLVNIFQNKANKIIEPFLTSKFILPASDKLNEALQEIELSRKLVNNDSILNKQLIIKHNILEVLKIIVSNKTESFDYALSLMNYNLKLFPNASYPDYLIGLINKKKNEIILAKQCFGNSMTKVPKWAEPRIKLAKTLFSECKFEESNKEYDKLISSNPRSILGYYHKATNLENLGYFKDAEFLLEKGLSIDTSNFAILDLLGNIYFKRGRFRQAEDFFKRSIENSQGSFPNAFLNMARLYFHIYSNYSREDTLLSLCIKNLKTAFELDSLDIETRNLTSEVFVTLAELGITYTDSVLNINDLREFASKTIMLDVFNSKSYYYAALIELFIKKFEPGGNLILQQAINKNPNYPYPYFYYGSYLYKAGKRDSSIYYFKKAIELAPKFLPPYLGLIKAYSTTARTKELSDLFHQSENTFSDNLLYNYQKLLFIGNGLKPNVLSNELNKLEYIDNKFVFSRLLMPNLALKGELQLKFENIKVNIDGSFIIENAYFFKKHNSVVIGNLTPIYDF